MEFFAESTVKGRKEHCCDACRKPIEVGIVHSYMRMKYDGDFSAVRNHMECREAECDLAKQAGVWGPEDWLFLHDLEREDAEWVKAKHPIAWSRIADRYAYLDEEDQPMTNEPEPNTRPLPQPSELVERLLTVGDDHAVLMESRDFDYCAGCPTDGCHCKRAVAETLAVYSQAAAQIAKLQIFADEQFKVDSEIQAHQQQQIAKLQARLEVVPGWSEDADGIACRNDTIKLQDECIAKLQADGDKLAGALEAFQRHYDLNDCDERCGALEVPISDLRRACQALTEWKDRA